MLRGLTTSARRLGVGCVLLCLLAGGQAVCAAESLADLVPAEAIVHVSVPDAPDLIAKVRAMPQAGLVREPAFRDAMGASRAKLLAGAGAVAFLLGAPDDEPDSALSGAFSVSVLPPAGRERRVLVLADLGEKRSRAVLGALTAFAEREGDGFSIDRTEYEGHAIFRVRGARAAALAGPVGPDAGARLRLCVRGGMLAATLSPDDGLMRSHLDLQDGRGGDSLGNSPDFRLAMGETKGEADVYLFVNPAALARLAGTAAVPEMNEALGIADLHAAALALRLTDDGVQMEGFLSAPAPRRGLPRASSSAEAVAEPPGFVTTDAVLFAAAPFDLSALWRDAFDALEDANPQAVETIRRALAVVPVNIERDVVGALGNRWDLVVSGPGAGRPGLALCADLADARSFRRAWGVLIAAYPPLVDPVVTDMNGASIYKLNIGRRRAGDVVGPERCLMLGGDRVVLTTSMDLAAAIARGRIGDGPPLRDDREFRELAARAGTAPAFLFFVEGRPALRAASWAVGVPEPPAGVVEKYASPAMVAGSWTEAGLRIHAFMPRPGASSGPGAQQP